ncbi:hypothetical protein [Promicromonospora soli]
MEAIVFERELVRAGKDAYAPDGRRMLDTLLETIPDPTLTHGPMALIPAAQLYVKDVPDLPHPRGADLLQILWCPTPNVEGESGWVFDGHIEIRWRRAEEVTHPRSVPPVPEYAVDPGKVAIPSVVSPERVVEYPPVWALSEDLRQRIGAWDEAQGNFLYRDECSVARGTKVGGWPVSTRAGAHGHRIPMCECGRRLEALVTFATCEWEPATGTRWVPIEDRNAAGAPVPTANRMPTDLQFSGGRSLQIFYCPASWDHSYKRMVF